MQHDRDRDRRRDEIDPLVDAWRADGLDDALIAMLELGKRAGRLHNLVQQAVRAELADHGLTYAEFEVLTVLRRAGSPYRLRPTDLTRSALLTSGGTSNVLQRLEKAGYVERGSDEGDGRGRWVRLTGEGLRVTEDALVASGTAHDDVLGSVPPEKLRAAADALRDVLAPITPRR
ncbi:MarR family winged helix-turn-helix transcriptional regulator [Actinomadura oligospora]|uniref:MarR family winged helix-turn-helix transcriptional regulator n=1 Tax=Actinomadura oligospora TaxID=111804 RepID=UPI0004AF755B|nr:MarR family transcriptional regulator [Actinomadura oligospora]